MKSEDRSPKPEAWTRVAVRPSHFDLRDAVSAAMFASGAEGLHEEGESLVTHLEFASGVDAIAAGVRAVDAHAEVESREIPAVDWSIAWRDTIRAHALGALTVAPPWLAGDLDPATTIVIDPAMAFGTGDHPTTRGVLRLMQRFLRSGDSVADLGSGSAVLAIAAAKLGATRVAAVEMDHDAISNAEENVARNGVSDRVKVIEGDAAVFLPLLAPVRVVLANIISSVLAELLPLIGRSLSDDGVAILSGILDEERASMLGVLAADGWRVLDEDPEGQWWSVAVARARAK
ncbi:MAG TPA: 50S ribosomal protein L11 methyltransferase [Gemmatimonadaceae bacterium]|jgi:ribosomal protein L11 methyltransferase|nr:50S ribosomal protein L11 methyltransferase [Gemmatimonadaceae bacterium]